MWPSVNPGSSPVAGALEIVHLDSLHSLSVLLRDFPQHCYVLLCHPFDPKSLNSNVTVLRIKGVCGGKVRQT